MPVRHSTRRRLLALAVFLFASIAYAAPAFAQASITIVNEKSLPRLDSRGATVQKRPLTLNPEGVNFQDCIDDQQIRFTLLMAGFEPNAIIEVWAANGGVDCGQQLNRASANQLCWQVAPNVPLQQQVDVAIPVRKIMSGAPPFKPTAPNETRDACGQVDLSNISVQFLYFRPGDRATAASKKDIGVVVDTVGPAPPTGLTALPGNTRIQVTWDNISGEGGVSALTGVKVYCDPAGGAPVTVETDASCREVPVEVDASDEAGEGGTTVDAGTVTVCDDGGTVTVGGGACSSANFLTVGPDGSEQPVVPDKEFDAQYACGALTGNTGTTAVAESVGGNPLVNGTRYAVAVAATDAYGNVGPLSDTVCQTPEITTDFWEQYREAGGDAGGGFCATSGPGAPVGSFATVAIVLAAAASSLRRRRDANGKDRR